MEDPENGERDELGVVSGGDSLVAVALLEGWLFLKTQSVQLSAVPSTSQH